MSWGKSNVPTKSPKVAGIDGGDISTNEQAVPVKWLCGLEWCPLTWITDKVYNQRTEEIRMKAGKGKETVSGYRYYGDVAGIACLGLADKVLAFESGNEIVWTGDVSRPDNPLHPDYWRAQITTPVAKLAFYWGRADQPVDDLLLAGIGAADPTLAHPAYRHQCPVILQDYFFGENTETVPNSRVLVWRAPRPALGNFPPQFAAGGESMVAAILELATNPIFGAGFPVTHFTAADWEALSADVLASLGGMSPSLDRAVALRDVVKDLQSYYDGWTRIQNGQLKPGRFPHDGSVPAGLTELSVHDFIDHPDVAAGTPSSTVNDVRVVYRDRNDLLKRKPATGSASANVKARKGHEPRVLDMPAFITVDQAARFAAEAAVSGAEGEWGGDSLRVRGPRAIWTGGAPLQAGDNFNLDLIAPQVDQVSRITRRVDFFRTPPALDFIAERGVYPTPYVPPSDLRPDIGKVVPLEIAQARILELTPDLAGTPLGLPVAFIAKRPKAEFEGATLPAANMVGFNAWYSPDGGSYDQLGNVSGWGVRGVVREALASASADVVVKLTLDADNLDLNRLAAQSAESQLNDTLLIVIGDELFSVGAIAIAGLDYDLTCKRVRLGSLPAAHGLGVEAWIVWRDEMRVFTHKGFVEDTDRYFKLQPYTATAVLELAAVDAILYHFRDRAPELPVIVLDALPGAPVVGATYNISGQISDVNGDLVSYQVQAVKLVASGGANDSEITLQSGDVKPDSKVLMSFKAPLVFPAPGYWVIIVRAYDETGGFKELKSAEMNVVLGTGAYGPDDGITPDPVTAVTVTGGLSFIFSQWTNPGNVSEFQVLIYVAAVAVKPANPSAVVDSPQAFYFLEGLPSSTTRYVWFEVKATKTGRKSAVAGPYNATTRAGIDLSDIVPGMELIGIVNALPNPVGYVGAKTVLLTTDGKLYRYSAGAWTAAVPTVDLTGQISTAQLADDAVTRAKIIADAIDALRLASDAVTNAKIAASAVTQTKIADDSISTSKIVANAITALKIAADAIIAEKIAANAVTTAKLDALAVTADKISANAVTTAKVDALAVTAEKIAALAVSADKIAANAVTTDKLDANSVTAGKIAAAAITAAAVGTNEIIANLANIADALITGAKIANATISTAKVADAAITTAKINDLAVNTLKIGDNAVTVPVSAETSGSVSVGTSNVVVQSVAIDVVGSEPVALFASFQFDPADNYHYWFTFHRDGTEIYAINYQSAIIGPDHDCLIYRDTPGAGSYTYELRIRQTDAGTTNFSKRFMMALSTKK